MKSRIAQIRKDNKLTQPEFAEKLGLSKNYISLVETGNRQLSDRTIKDICEKFSINEEWLRTGEGNMQSELVDFAKMCSIIGMTDPDGKEWIEKYFKLSAEDKKLMNDFLKRFLK